MAENFIVANRPMFLGIEIGGTKLQLGVGSGDGAPLVELERHTVEPARGAAGIREQIAAAGARLLAKHAVAGIGIGFGGPVNAATGKIIRSYQIPGWDDFDLAGWSHSTLGFPTFVANDCDAAALAEARFGAGRGCGSMFYVTVGTGIGGGLIVGGRIFGNGRPAVAEIGHLRPGLLAEHADATVEAIASGWGISAGARAAIAAAHSEQADPDRDDLLRRCEGRPERLTARVVGEAAEAGNRLARKVLGNACRALGWAIAQSVTLIAPEAVVVGGGVSLIGEREFFEPLRREVGKYVFPPLAGSFRIVPAELGELVVVHGALTLAAEAQ